MARCVEILKDMGPAAPRVATFVAEVFAPDVPSVVDEERCRGDGVLVCGDWRVIGHGSGTEPGWEALRRCLGRATPALVVYALLGRKEIARALEPRGRGATGAQVWKAALDAGARVVVLQLDRCDARRPFTPQLARATLDRLPVGRVVLWHDPDAVVPLAP